MRCKKHPIDSSSSLGVCASCLRQRLLSLIAAQSRQAPPLSHPAPDDHPPKPHPPPLLFPRSVSPYVTRRKSDGSDTWPSPRRFYTTPQLGPTQGSDAPTSTEFTSARSFEKKTRFSLLSSLFRSRSDMFDSGPNASDPGFASRDSCEASSSSPSSWLSTIFSTRRKKKPTVCYIEDVIARDRGRRRPVDRGMSPAIGSESEEECEPSTSNEVSPGRWKRTPVTGPTAVRRARAGHARNMSGLAICLSPLVRASPSRYWSKKGGMAPELSYSGEIRGPMKQNLSTASSFCANRSRKLADMGRSNHNR